MAPGKRKIGLRPEDAARDRMKVFGFDKCVIDASIKQVLEVYGEDNWFLIEDANYEALFETCLEKKKEQEETALEEEEEEEEEEKEANVLPITSDEAVMDSSPAAFHFVEASVDCSVEGATSSHCGWLSSEDEETNQEKDSDGDNDDEMIQLTPEPLCEKLEELLREVYGEKKMRHN